MEQKSFADFAPTGASGGYSNPSSEPPEDRADETIDAAPAEPNTVVGLVRYRGRGGVMIELRVEQTRAGNRVLAEHWSWRFMDSALWWCAASAKQRRHRLFCLVAAAHKCGRRTRDMRWQSEPAFSY